MINVNDLESDGFWGSLSDALILWIWQEVSIGVCDHIETKNVVHYS